MTEARGSAVVCLSLQSRGLGRGLEGALAVSGPLCDLFEEYHLV